MRDEFFDLIERMFAKLHARALDPTDKKITCFPWSHPSECPAANWYNMDEIGSDTNKARKKKVEGKGSQHDGLKHNMEDTDGDNNPFHVTNCMTTCAAGTTDVPPYLGHSNPSAKSKTDTCRVTRKYADGICEKIDGQWHNPTGINLFVTKSGSMTKERFPSFCRHFVNNLPQGQGKGGEPVILVFDGHASRWNYSALSYLLANNIYCLCLPGHTSIWAQPNDGGPNASFKSALGDAIAKWRSVHRPLPGSEAIVKMTRADFNRIFSQTWLTWTKRMRIEKAAGGNAITTGWRGTGLFPYNRDAPYWSAAISKFGKREELALSTSARSGLAAPITQAKSFYAGLEAAFAAQLAAPRIGDGNDETAAIVADTTAAMTETDDEAMADAAAEAAVAEETAAAMEPAAEEVAEAQEAGKATPTGNGALPVMEVVMAEAAIEWDNEHETDMVDPATPQTPIVPATGSQAVMEAAVERVKQSTKMHNFTSLLKSMKVGECVTLRGGKPAEAGREDGTAGGAGTAGDMRASLVVRADSYLLVHGDRSCPPEEIGFNEIETKLANRFAVPKPSKAELSVDEAQALRKREVKQAAAARAAERAAAVEAATADWYRQQAELAAELGITCEDWKRIVALLMKPPPVRIGADIVMNSVATGRAIVIDAAVEDALAAPLHESVRNAAQRAEEAEAEKQRPKASLTQTLYGKDVTEQMDEFETAELTASAAAEAKKKRADEASCARVATEDAKVRDACRKLLCGRVNGDIGRLALADLCTLIRWRKGTVPKDHSKGNRDAVEQAWAAVAAPKEELVARAGGEGVPDEQPKAAPKAKAKAPPKPRKKAADSSDDEGSDSDGDCDGGDDDDDMACDTTRGGGEDSDSEDGDSDDEDEDEDGNEDEDDEDTYNTKCIHAQKGKGKTLQYLVEWEGYPDSADYTWEPVAFLTNNTALDEWQAIGRQAWEAAKKKK